MTCNGWKNSETWTVSLWFTDILQDVVEDGVEITADYVEGLVMDFLESEGQLPESGLVADVMSNFFKQVDWQGIADHHSPFEE